MTRACACMCMCTLLWPVSRMVLSCRALCCTCMSGLYLPWYTLRVHSCAPFACPSLHALWMQRSGFVHLNSNGCDGCLEQSMYWLPDFSRMNCHDRMCAVCAVCGCGAVLCCAVQCGTVRARVYTPRSRFPCCCNFLGTLSQGFHRDSCCSTASLPLRLHRHPHYTLNIH